MSGKCHPLAGMDRIVRAAVEEDVGGGDVTSGSLIPRAAVAEAEMIAVGPCVISGLPVAARVFAVVDPRLAVSMAARDGERCRAGRVVMRVKGSMRSILTAERTALNFVQRMSGIATMTDRFVRKCAGRVRILDTRKTAPGLRLLDKYAVKCGGGTNHRMGLYDMALIKDNHRRLLCSGPEPGLDRAVKVFRKAHPGLPVEVEVETIPELESALKARPDWIMLDNMTPAMMRRCARICNGRCRLEASGGVTLVNIAAVSRTGVDAVSIGALTHSAPAADISLEVRSIR